MSCWKLGWIKGDRISGWFHPNKNPMEITIDPNHLLISNWPSAHFAFGRLGNFPRFHEDDWNHLVFPTFSPSFPQVPSSFRPFTAAKKKKTFVTSRGPPGELTCYRGNLHDFFWWIPSKSGGFSRRVLVQWSVNSRGSCWKLPLFQSISK